MASPPPSLSPLSLCSSSPLLLPLKFCNPVFFLPYFLYLSLSLLLVPRFSFILPQRPCCFSSKLNLRSLAEPPKVLHMQKARSRWVYACVCALFAAVISQKWGWGWNTSDDMTIGEWKKRRNAPYHLPKPPRAVQLLKLLSCGRSFCWFLHPEKPCHF